MQEKKHIASLDGLRGMAAAAVAFSHPHQIFPSLAPFMITGVGGRAVAIFFALSGFLMAYLYGDRPISRKAVADFPGQPLLAHLPGLSGGGASRRGSIEYSELQFHQPDPQHQ